MTLNDIPKSGQSLGQTKVPINQNFQNIDAAFLVNHVPYTITSQGKHTLLEMVNQVAHPTTAPPASLLPGEITIYNFVNPVSTVNEAYIVKVNSGGVLGTSIPFTLSQLTGVGGYTYLPSGLLLQWGTVTVNIPPSSNPVTITYPTVFTIPAYNVVVSTLSNFNGDSDTFVRVSVFSVNPASFTVWCSPRTTTGSKTAIFTFFAIGT